MMNRSGFSVRTTTLASAGAVILASGTVYACLFNYFQCLPFRVLMLRLSSPEGRRQFFGNMVSIRFWRSSIRHCLRYHWRLLTSVPRALEGKKAPDATLMTLDRQEKSLYHDYLNTEAILEIYREFCSGSNKVANMLTIYIEEAHAVDDWSLPPGRLSGFGAQVKMAKSIEDRIFAAKKFIEEMKYPVEMVCDSMTGEALLHYEAWPERLYVIENGAVVLQGGLGPHDYRPQDVKNWLCNRFGREM